VSGALEQSKNILLIKVLILVIRLTNLLLTLASPPLLPEPNAGSATALDHPTVSFNQQFVLLGDASFGRREEVRSVPRARNRSSDKIAMAFTRRTLTVFKIRSVSVCLEL
jgi:hypothetical protein